jgi:hypothetical protein
VDAVVRVCDHELAAGVLNSMQQIEEDNGVETAGDGDERRTARQSEGGKLGAEPVREVHARKVSPGRAHTPSRTSTSARWTRVMPCEVSSQR